MEDMRSLTTERMEYIIAGDDTYYLLKINFPKHDKMIEMKSKITAMCVRLSINYFQSWF